MLLHIIVLDEKLSPAEGHVIFIAILYDKVRIVPHTELDGNALEFVINDDSSLTDNFQLRDNWWRGDVSLSQSSERLLFRQVSRSTVQTKPH